MYEIMYYLAGCHFTLKEYIYARKKKKKERNKINKL